MLSILSGDLTLNKLSETQGEAFRLLEQRIAELERGEVDTRRLIVEQVLSRAPEDYAVQTRAAIAARKFRNVGVPIHPGESVGYVINKARTKLGGSPSAAME